VTVFPEFGLAEIDFLVPGNAIPPGIDLNSFEKPLIL